MYWAQRYAGVREDAGLVPKALDDTFEMFFFNPQFLQTHLVLYPDGGINMSAANEGENAGLGVRYKE